MIKREFSSGYINATKELKKRRIFQIHVHHHLRPPKAQNIPSNRNYKKNWEVYVHVKGKYYEPCIQGIIHKEICTISWIKIKFIARIHWKRTFMALSRKRPFGIKFVYSKSRLTFSISLSMLFATPGYCIFTATFKPFFMTA